MASPVVYFIKVVGQDLFKIGFTSATVRQRVRAVNVGCPFDVEEYATIPAPDREQTEKAIHKQLEQYHRKGEWFDAPLNVVNFIVITTMGHKFASDKIKHPSRSTPRPIAKGKGKKRKSRGRPSRWCALDGCDNQVSKRATYCGPACRQKAHRERTKKKELI